MTLQVAMIARDGFIVASDKKVWGRTPRNDRKISLSETGNVAIAAAGTSVAGRFANKLVTLLDVRADLYSKTKNVLEEESRRILDDWKNNSFDGFVKALSENDNRLIVVLRGTPHLWEIILSALEPLVNLLTEDSEKPYTTNGHLSNRALYFVDRHFSADKSADELKLLAAFTILEGAEFDRQYIGGLDILLHKQNAPPRFLDKDELCELEKRCQELHETLDRELFKSK